MIDPIKILQRAWQILWNYRTLWIFGLILALAAGGSVNGGGNNSMQWREDNQNHQGPSFGSLREALDYFNRELHRLFTEGIPQANITGEALTAFLWTVSVFVVFMLLVGIVVSIAYYISETAVIRMTDEYESTGNRMTLGQGVRLGWSRTSWRLFLINLIVHLPVIVLFLILLITGITIFQGVLHGTLTFNPVNIAVLIGLLLLGVAAVVVLSVVLSLLRPFFWRVSVFEDLGVRESIQQGLALVRENWKSVGLMWLVMIGLGIAWIVVSILAVIITIPIVILTCLVAALVVAIPALLLFALFSTFLTGPLPWIAAGLFVLPLFFLIGFSPWLLLGSWQSVYTSTVWTLTYREIKALPAATPPAEVLPVGD